MATNARHPGRSLIRRRPARGNTRAAVTADARTKSTTATAAPNIEGRCRPAPAAAACRFVGGNGAVGDGQRTRILDACAQCITTLVATGRIAAIAS